MSEQENETQETSNLETNEATPDNNTETNDSTTPETGKENQPKTVTVEIPENWEYNGDRKSVPKPLEKYVKNLDRYVSQKDQTLAETKKRLEEVESVINSDSFKQYQEYVKNSSQQKQNEPLFTQDEMDAISLGDANTFQKVLDRAVERKLELDPNRSSLEQTVRSLSERDKLIQTKEQIQSFSQEHPDFKEMVESPIGDYMIAAAKQGIGLEQIYENAKAIESYMNERVEKTRKANLEAKAKGSSVKSTVTGTTDVVWADNDNDARRLAIELQLKGDPRQVRIKPKK